MKLNCKLSETCLNFSSRPAAQTLWTCCGWTRGHLCFPVRNKNSFFSIFQISGRLLLGLSVAAKLAGIGFAIDIEQYDERKHNIEFIRLGVFF